MSRLQLLSSWSKEQTCLLLKVLQQHPVIYDQTHPLYQYRVHRLAALRKIIVKLRPIKPGMTPQLISNKIRVLKSQYWKEKKWIKDSLANLKPGQKPYKPKLWCFNMLTFLDKNGTYDKNALSEEEEEDVAAEEEIEGAVEDCNDVEPNDPIRSFEEVEIETIVLPKATETSENGQRSALQTKCLKLVDCLTKEMTKIKDDKDDNLGSNRQSPNRFLGLLVESELSKVTEEIYDDSKWKIMRILEEASKKNREAKIHPVQINLSSTSASTSSSSASYNLGRETRVTVLDNFIFKTPIQTPICSKQKLLK